MPGPIAACGRSTGAIAPCWSLRSASGSSSCSAAMKPAAVGRRRVVGARAQGEDDRGGEGVRCRCDASGRRRSLRIGQVAVIAQPDRIIPSSSVSQPVEAVAVVTGVGLLERVVDGDRVVGQRGLARAREHAPEALLEELLRAVLAVVAVRVGDELLGLRDEHRAQQVGVDAAQRAAQPDVEEVREVGVADVVVVRRVRRDERAVDVDRWRRLLELTSAPVVARARVPSTHARLSTDDAERRRSACQNGLPRRSPRSSASPGGRTGVATRSLRAASHGTSDDCRDPQLLTAKPRYVATASA